MADPSDKQKPWLSQRQAPRGDLPFEDDDELPTGMVPRHQMPDEEEPAIGRHRDGARRVPDRDTELTLVDYRMPQQAPLPYRDTALVEPNGGPRSRPGQRGPDTDELLLDELSPLGAAPDVSDPFLSSPAMSGGEIRVPLAKRNPALPLPAPPSRSEPVARPPLPKPPPRAPDPLDHHSVISSSRRAPPPAAAPAAHAPSARVPTPIEDHDRSTAVVRDPLAPLRTPLIGGRYRIVERVGVGGMGKVYKVTHAQLGKTFALKIISDSMAGDEKIRELFYREARMASSLSHPNIASVVDFGEDAKLGAFMVMEFIEGEALAKRLHREGRIGVRLALDIIRQVAEALDYIHAKGIIHCDIKAENILLLEIPGAQQRRVIQVKLLDFGLARSTVASRNTQSLAGTPHYVAPDRIRGAQPSPTTDIYSLGVLFYEILTGKVPWDGSVDQILRGHLELMPTPPSQLIEGGLDAALEKLVLRSLAKNPVERHKDAAAFLYELQTVLDMLGYGRPGRRKRGGAAKQVVTRRNQRDETARALFDASRVPMALISREGVILVANPAFAQFIMGVSVDVEGLNVHATPLVGAWATFDSDLSRACAGTSMRRTIEVEIDVGRTRRLLMWLDPGLSEDQAIFGVHPLDER